MAKNTVVIGLTGGIGAGKSTLAQIMKLKGAIVVDADEVAREVIAPSGVVWKKLVDHFGDAILLKDKTIDRRKLGSIVFFDADELEALDRFTHPAIRDAIRRRVSRLKKRAADRAVIIIDAPLLVETGLDRDVDKVIVVRAGQDLRLERLRKNGLTVKEARARIRSQTPDDKRQEYADHLLTNEGSFQDLQKKAARIWREIQKQFDAVPEARGRQARR